MSSIAELLQKREALEAKQAALEALLTQPGLSEAREIAIRGQIAGISQELQGISAEIAALTTVRTQRRDASSQSASDAASQTSVPNVPWLEQQWVFTFAHDQLLPRSLPGHVRAMLKEVLSNWRYAFGRRRTSDVKVRWDLADATHPAGKLFVTVAFCTLPGAEERLAQVLKEFALLRQVQEPELTHSRECAPVRGGRYINVAKDEAVREWMKTIDSRESSK